MKTLNEQVFELVPVFHTQVIRWIDRFKANMDVEVDKMMWKYADNLFLKILGLEKDNWGSIRNKQGNNTIERILSDKAIAQIDRILDCNIPPALNKKVRAEYKRVFEAQLLCKAADKASDDADAIANFIHTELTNSAISLEDVQKYIQTYQLVRGNTE